MDEEADIVFLGIKEECVLVCGNKAFEKNERKVCTVSQHQSLDRTILKKFPLLFVLSHWYGLYLFPFSSHCPLCSFPSPSCSSLCILSVLLTERFFIWQNRRQGSCWDSGRWWWWRQECCVVLYVPRKQHWGNETKTGSPLVNCECQQGFTTGEKWSILPGSFDTVRWGTAWDITDATSRYTKHTDSFILITSFVQCLHSVLRYWQGGTRVCCLFSLPSTNV